MKLHLHTGQEELSGYINIDVYKYKISLSNLDNICETSECTEIILDNLLKFVPHNMLESVVAHLISKLRHKGLLKLIFSDLRHIIREFNIGNINEEQLNTELFNGANSCCSYYYILNILKKTDTTISSISLGDKTVICIERK